MSLDMFPMQAPQVPLPWTRLPFHFDAVVLQGEADAIPVTEWVPHFNRNDYEGAWSSIALRSRTSLSSDIAPHGASSDFHDTPVLSASPAMRQVLEQFHMPLKSVRLLRLHAGSRVREHRDYDLGLRDGELRIHVPVRTSDAVEFIVANRRLRLREGESWFIDFSQPHRIHNAGAEDRIHLVLDGEVNDWAERLLQRSAQELVTETEEPAGITALRSFCEEVFDSAELQQRLLPCDSNASLTEAVVHTGKQRGYHFRDEDVTALLNANRHTWLTRTVSL